MRLRAVGAVAAVLAAAAMISAVPAQAASGPTAHPTSNTEPSRAFLDACYSMTTSKADNDRCDAAALVDFNAVRANERLPAMTLPTGFDTLSVPLQLLAIADIERVDRGLAPVAGLSSNLNSLAQTGANNDEDPSWPSPFPGTAGTANWAGSGNSALLDDFYWMYDDGYGSGNYDCGSPGASGCWGHRDDILYPFSNPIRMGAAVAYGTDYGTSMTEEFIGGDGSDPVDVSPNWATISGAPTFRLDTARLVVVSDTDHPSRGKVVASGSGGSQHLRATVKGTGWSVTPATCTLTGTGRCQFSVHFNPPSSGSSSGHLKVTGAAGTKKVTLTGWQAPPRLSAVAPNHQVKAGHRVRITGVIATHSDVAIAHHRIRLQRRSAAGGRWHDVRSRRSRAKGVVHFVVRPTRSMEYRLVAIARNGKVESTSRPMVVRLRG